MSKCQIDPGICAGGTRKCRNPHLPGRYYCEAHAIANRAKARRHYVSKHPGCREGQIKHPPGYPTWYERNREYQVKKEKGRYEYRVAHGLCVVCAGNWAEPGVLTCRWCREVRRLRNRRLREQIKQ